MKTANRAPSYAIIYHGLAEIARKYGYALAIHGSMLTDLDLIAVPWTETASDEKTVMLAIVDHCNACGVNTMDDGKNHHEPQAKPHGRLAWKIFMEAGGSVDLSVMPRIKD
jgi:hypothetical protein